MTKQTEIYNLKLLENHLECSLVKISWQEVLRLVVIDLKEKYSYNKEQGNDEWAEIFKKVLSYYLEEDEITEVLNE